MFPRLLRRSVKIAMAIVLVSLAFVSTSGAETFLSAGLGAQTTSVLAAAAATTGCGCGCAGGCGAGSCGCTGESTATSLTNSEPVVMRLTASQTLTVTATSTTAWLINGNANPTLTLQRGVTYTFQMSGVSAIHQLYIKTIAGTGTGNQFTEGVTNNGASGNATLTFTVPQDAPNTLFYSCVNHSAMTGLIDIVPEPSAPWLSAAGCALLVGAVRPRRLKAHG